MGVFEEFEVKLSREIIAKKGFIDEKVYRRLKEKEQVMMLVPEY